MFDNVVKIPNKLQLLKRAGQEFYLLQMNIPVVTILKRKAFYFDSLFVMLQF